MLALTIPETCPHMDSFCSYSHLAVILTVLILQPDCQVFKIQRSLYVSFSLSLSLSLSISVSLSISPLFIYFNFLTKLILEVCPKDLTQHEVNREEIKARERKRRK